MSKFIETIIVGGGQAGLSLSYYLTQKGREHIIFERAPQAADAWRNHRWDSFTLVTPNWMIQLPGAEYQGSDPDGYLPRDQIVQLFEQYIAQYHLPVQHNTLVSQVEKTEGGFDVKTDRGTFQATNVVIATGFYHQPKIPAFSSNVLPSIQQIHSSQYRNPDSLPVGAVLVVGAGQSGLQIAEELYQNGRKVYLCVSNVIRMPRRYRGKDATWWFDKVGFFDRTVDQLASPKAKYASFPQLSGKNGGHWLNLHQFARDGVALMGHIQGAAGGKITLAPDLMEILAKIDQNEAETLKKIDMLVEKTGMNIPVETVPVLRDGYDQEVVAELDLETAGVTGIVWGTGYSFDYSLVSLPVFEEDGYPRQKRGVTDYPGLYFLGMVWLHKGKSSLLYGVGEDAAYLADQIERRT